MAEFRKNLLNAIQRITKGQQLKGKIVSEFFTFSQFFALFQKMFSPGLSPSKQRALAQGEQKRRKDKIKRPGQIAMLHVSCCTRFFLLLAMAQALSSSNFDSFDETSAAPGARLVSDFF